MVGMTPPIVSVLSETCNIELTKPRKGSVEAALFQMTKTHATMETTEKNNQDKCSDNLSQKEDPIEESCWSILDNNDAINVEGCRFFVEAKSSQPTCISSYQLRWFTYEFDDKTEQETQEKARAIIKNEAEQNSDKTEKIDMSILLYSDPTQWREKGIETKYIENLLNCQGVIVKYLDTKEDEQLLRISLSGKKLLLSTSKLQENKVRKGFLYEAKTDGSLLLEIFEKRFNQNFEQAKKIILKDGKITFEKKARKKLSDRQINEMSLFTGIFPVIKQFAKSIIKLFQ
jgi:hypothetical protein